MRVFLLGLLLLSCCPLPCAPPAAGGQQAGEARFVEALWKAEIPAGQYRYYDGLWHLMGLMHCGGGYRIWTPK